MSESRPPSVPILGVPVHALTYADLLAQIAGFIAQGTPHQIATVNPEFIMLAQRDAAFRQQSGPTLGAFSDVTGRYNARVNEYNARCANQPRNPDVLARVQATLSCPPPY